MSIYSPIIEEKDIRKGILLFNVKSCSSENCADKGPGIVSFHDPKKGKYRIYFFWEGIETGLLEGNIENCRSITEQEMIQLSENILYDMRKEVKDLSNQLSTKESQLKNAESAYKIIPAKIKEYSE